MKVSILVMIEMSPSAASMYFYWHFKISRHCISVLVLVVLKLFAYHYIGNWIHFTN